MGIFLTIMLVLESEFKNNCNVISGYIISILARDSDEIETFRPMDALKSFIFFTITHLNS